MSWRKSILLTACLLTLSIAATTVTAAVYHIDPVNGNDSSGDGSSGSPWKSFANIITYYTSSYRPSGWVDIAPGDTIYLMNGTHNTIVHPGDGGGPTGGGSHIAYFRHEDGNTSNWIYIKAYPGHSPVMDPQYNGKGINIYQCSYWDVSGIEIKNAYGRGVDLGDSDYIKVHDMEIHDTDGRNDDNVTGLEVGNTGDVEIYNCVFYDNFDRTGAQGAAHNSTGMVCFNGFDTTRGDVTVHDCVFYQTRPTSQISGAGLKYKHANQNPNAGFYVYNNTFTNNKFLAFSSSCSNTNFHHNLIEDGASIRSVDEGGITHQTNLLFEYNTIYGSKAYNFNPSINYRNTDFPNDPTNVVFQNNIIYDDDGAYDKYGGMVDVGTYMEDDIYNICAAALTFSNNCYYNPNTACKFNFAGGGWASWGGSFTFSGWQSEYGYDTDSVEANPLFVDAPNGDFHLQGGSPAQGMGMYAGTGPQPPGQASNPSPGSGATSVSVDTDLSWSGGSGATSSDVYFGTDSTPDSGEFQGNQTATTFDPGTMANDTTYYWRIDEINAEGTTTGNVWNFTTEAAPQPPGQANNPSPANSAADVSTTADLSWTAGSGATSHDVYFGTDSTPDSGEFQGNQAAITYDPGTMSESTTYYWRIDEVNAAGTTTGNVWSFTTGTAPAAFQQDSGTDGIVSMEAENYDVYTQQGTHSWISVTTPSGYSGSAAMNTTPNDGTNINTGYAANSPRLDFQVDFVKTGTHYVWIRGYGATGSDDSIHAGLDGAEISTCDRISTFSTSYTWSKATMDGADATFNVASTGVHTVNAWMREDGFVFDKIVLTTNAGYTPTGDGPAESPRGGGSTPGQASSPSPADSATDVSITTDLSWTAGADSTSHDVYFGTSSPGAFQGNQTATTYDTGTMSNDTTYYWRIDEVNANDTTTGAVWSFTTIVAAPGQASSPSPADSATEVSVAADLSWTAGSDATSHDVYFGTTSPGTFRGNQTATTFDAGTMDYDTTYYWRIDEINTADTTTGAVWSFTTTATAPTNECDNWQTLHPEWIFCDDFESTDPMVGTGRYYEYNSDGGDFAPTAGVGLDNSKGMRVIYQSSEVDAGSIKLGFGRVPSSYFDKGIRNTEDFSEIYYRIYLKTQDGWQGQPQKLSRATVFAASDWSQAMIAHHWGSGNYYLKVDPVSCVDASSQVVCVGYNDFANMDWLGGQAGTTPIFDSDNDGIWHYVEVHVKLNNPGQANGIHEFWVDGVLDARAENLDFVTSYTDYAINAVLVENYWDDGAPALLERYIDNFVVSTQPIGQWTGGGPTPPGQAANPSPADSATDVSITADLSWTAGSGSTSSDVYFGTTSPGTFQGNQTASTFDPGTMANGTTYYWRIDEINAEGTTTGVVWNFTTIVAAPGQASSPSPAHSASNISINADLSWNAGSGATSHDVYFGTSSPGAFQGNQTAATFDTGTMSNNTTYYWRIDELNAGGTTNGTVWSFTTIVAAPGQASSPSPADSATGVSTTTDLSWNAGSGATSHDVYFGTSSPGAFQGNQAAATFDPGAMSNNTTYYWRIDELNAGGTTTGTVWSFTTIVGAPAQATNPSPANTATDVSTTSDLSWTAGSGATSHDVYFGTSSPGSYQGNQTAATFDTGSMANDTTYYWRIDEVNAGGTTAGNVWSFTTIVAPPGQAASPSPANAAGDIDINANLSWTAGSGAASHDVYFGTSSPGSYQGNQAATTFDPGTMNNDTTYYWRIDEVNAGGTTAGTVWSFTTIIAPPAQATGPSPADTATDVDADADLSWSAGSGAASHDVYFGTTSPGSFQGNQAAATFDPGTMANNTTYYWRIDEINAGGTTTGNVWSFTTVDEEPPPSQYECDDWQTLHPEWIFCDDFETTDPMVGTGRYFEYNNNSGDFVVVDGVGFNSSRGVRTIWQTSEVSAGNFKLAFGRNPSAYMDKGIRNTEDFREIYYRLYLKTQDGWQGQPQKLSRATVIAASDWSQAMIAHHWGSGGGQYYIAVDPVSCVDASSQVVCVGYNDFANFEWLGSQSGITPIFDSDHDDIWHCIEVHVKLNDPGQANGIEESWINGTLDARRENLDFVTSYTDYAINAVFVENYWDTGSPQLQERYFDNFVVSTQPIGTRAIVVATNPEPADDAADISINTTLNWTPGDYADTHDVYLGTDVNAVSDANHSSAEFMGNVDVNNYDPCTLDYSTTYYWAIDEVNDTITWTGTVWSFTTEAMPLPGQASNPSPADSETDVSITADLSWTAGSGSTSSDVYFGTTSPGAFQGNQTATTFDPGTMDNDTTYYWRIDEVNAAGSTTGSVWSFTTIVAQPGQATNPDPADTATNVSTDADLSWTAGAGSTSSDVYFGTTSPGTFQGNQTATTFDPGAMANDTTYYWRIDEVNTSGSTTGVVWSFTTIVAAPGQATNPSPASGATNVNVDADLSWTAGSGATSHDVYFGTTSPGTFQGNQTATTFEPGTMANDTTYYWRIDEISTGGTTTGNVWSFTTIVSTGDEIIGWWELNYASGGTATDSTVYAHNGTLNGPAWLNDAEQGWCLDFNSSRNDYVSIGDESFFDQTGNITVMAWINAGYLDWSNFSTVIAKGRDGQGAWALQKASRANAMSFFVDVTGMPWDGIKTNLAVFDSDWHHIAGVYDGSNAYIYVDGGLDSNSVACSGSIVTNNWPVYIGQNPVTWAEPTNARGWIGLIDDVRVYNYALTQSEINDIYTGGPTPPGQASNPSPTDSATDVSIDADLSWTAGTDSTSSDVYFGTTSPGTFQGNQTATTFDPGTMSNDTTYYWRIDEINTAGTTTGVVWSFTTESAGLLPWTDGFESGDLVTGGWNVSGDATVAERSAYTGSYGAEVASTSWMEKAISTAGFTSIHVKYVRKTKGLDSGEYLYVEWYDGGGWNLLESTQDTSWVSKDITCPAGADNNAGFKVRFRTDADKGNEYAAIDDVEITGTSQ